MALRVDSTLETSALNAACDDLVGNADGGSIEFYTGSPPASLGDAPGETKLADVTMPSPAFGDASSGTATLLGVPLQTTCDNDGTIGWARVLNSGGSAIWDESDVGTSGNAIVVDSTSVVENQEFKLNSYTFTVDAS